jgi:hypothetical protein
MGKSPKLNGCTLVLAIVQIPGIGRSDQIVGDVGQDALSVFEHRPLFRPAA